MHQYPGTVYKIAKNTYQFAVVSILKILPGKIVVFCFRGIGTKHITQHIFAAGKIFYVFMHPHSPVAAGTYFLALNI